MAPEQMETARQVFVESGFQNVHTIKDLNGGTRVIEGESGTL